MSTIGLNSPSSAGKTTCRRGTASSSPRKSGRSGPTFVRPSTDKRARLEMLAHLSNDAVPPPRPRARQSPLARLEQLDQIARRVDQQNLRSSRSAHDVVSKLHAGGAQACDLSRKILHDQV